MCAPVRSMQVELSLKLVRRARIGCAGTRRRKLAEALTAYTSYAAQKMRRQGLATASISIMLTTNKHTQDAQYYATRPVRLTIGTADTGRLIRAALWALRGIYKPGFRYKKCGILLLDLHPAEAVQGSFFIRPDQPKRVQLMASIDALNARYGRDRVRYATSGIDRPWKLRSEYLSQRYTTRWGELLNV